MEPTDAKTFGMHLDQLGSVFNVELPLQKKHGYWVALEDLPLEAVQYACVEVLKTEGFMPAPSVLRSHAREWTRLAKHQRPQPPQLREDLLSLDELRQLQMQIWPEERDRLLKDPVPPYEEAP
jgi:hypothetical protein